MLPASEWQPSVDISETDQALQVKVDLPGIKPEDVEISVDVPRQARIVELHTMTLNCLCQLIEHRLFGGYNQE